MKIANRDADSKIDPLPKPRIAKMRKTIQAIESIKAKASPGPRCDPSDMLTAFEDILLTVGNCQTEAEHRVKMIAERAIAKAQKR